MKIILLGPPLAGKGTQGQFLAERFHLRRLSVGALIRKLYIQKTPEGIEAGKYIIKGKAIPGELLMSIVIPWLTNYKKGFIIDNFIRSHDQLLSYRKYAKQYNFFPDVVINIKLSEPQMLTRLSSRIEEHKKQKIFRPDETIETLKTRLEVYESGISEILSFFKKTTRVIEVEGVGSVLKVHDEIIKKLGLNGLTDDY